MRIARVEGVASPVRKVDGFAGRRIVIVSLIGGSSESLMAAADPLQAAVGDFVLVAEGRSARATLDPADPDSSVLDAAVVAIVRREEVTPSVLDRLDR